MVISLQRLSQLIVLQEQLQYHLHFTDKEYEIEKG